MQGGVEKKNGTKRNDILLYLDTSRGKEINQHNWRHHRSCKFTRSPFFARQISFNLQLFNDRVIGQLSHKRKTKSIKHQITTQR